uniref:Histone-lysine N-methyltransferase SETMAR n=2 Tax=Bursaphelenchus xylophilus TaxID=6326 RepID=A0A1I7S375_BURXY
MDFIMIDDNIVEEDDILEGCACTGTCTFENGCNCLIYKKNYNGSGRLIDEFNSINPVLECHDECKCDSECSNRLVGNGCKKKLDPFYDQIKGYGLKASESIYPKEFVIEYKGEVISEEEAWRRAKKYKDDGREHNYIYTINEHLEDRIQRTFIDATSFGGLARFINHSCSPNLTPVVVRCGRISPQLALFANKVINAGDELCYDYGSSSDPVGGGKKCHCGASDCRGFLPSGSYGKI